MPEEIGALSIRLELDREDFDRDLQSLEGIDIGLGITPKLNTDGISKQLQGLQGEVAVGLRLDKGQFEQQVRDLGTQSGLTVTVGLRLDDSGVLEQAKQLTDRLEQQFGQVKLHLKPTVDDSALTKLNQHLDIKDRHFARVGRNLKSNPLTPAVDMSGLDTASAQLDAFQQRVADLQNQAVSVKFSADTSEVDAQIGRLQGKSIRLKSTVEGGESSATESADVFAKAIAKAIKKSSSKGIFGSLLDGIGSIATAPFKIIGSTISNVFTGVGLGVGEQISKDLGKGLFAGIEDELSPLIGSFKLLGREAGSALTKEILNALGQDGVVIQGILGDLIGRDKILVESGASQARSKKERNQSTVEATRFFAEERQEKDVVAISNERKKLFVDQPAQIEEIRDGLNRKVSASVKKLDSKRIEQVDQGKLDGQSALAQKLLESENAKLTQLRSRLAQQRQAIAAAEQKVADLGRIDNKSPEFQAARADLNAQKTAFAQTKKEELASASTVSGAREKLSEIADAPKSIQTQIKNAAKRSAAESRRLEALQKSLSQQGQAIAIAEGKVAKLQQLGDNSPELSKAEADLAIKKQRFAETQQDASVVASSVERYSNKLTDLSEKLNSLQELAAKAFEGEFEKLERLNEQLLVNQREFTKKGQILESTKVLGTIRTPESIDAEITERRARIQDLQNKKGAIAATSKSESVKLQEVQRLKAEDLAQARTGGAPLAAPDLTPEQVKAGQIEFRPVQQQADRAIQKLQAGQIQRQGLYRNLAKEIEQEERQLRSLAAQKSDPLAKKTQANTLRQTLATLIQLEKDSSPEEAQAALQKGDEARVRRLLAQRKYAIEEQAKIKRELALLGEEASGATQSVQSVPSSPPAPVTQTTQAVTPKPKAPAPAASAPDLYKQVVRRTAQEVLGKDISEEQIPELSGFEGRENSAGFYQATQNQIGLRKQSVDLLNQPITKANLAELTETIGFIVHETTHAAQADFGKNNFLETGINSIQDQPTLVPTPEEVRKLGSRIERSTSGAASGTVKTPEQQRIVRGLESQAYVAESRLGPKIAQDLIKQKAISQFQEAQGIGGGKLEAGLVGLLGDLRKVTQEAKEAGIEVAAEQEAILQQIRETKQIFAPLLQKGANLEILPTEEILDLQEEFEKSVGALVPIAGDIQRLKDRIAGKAEQAGVAQPGAIGPTSGQAAASNFKDTLGLGAGKLRRGLEEVQVQVNSSLQEIAEIAAGLGIDASEEIRDAIATIDKANAELEPLFDKAAQVDILPAEEIAALQEQIQAKTQKALDTIAQQPDIVTQQLEDKASGGGGGGLATQEVSEPAADRKELQQLLRQFGVKKLRPLAQQFGIDTEGLKKGQIINRLTSEVDPQALQPKVFELTRAKAQQQIARREQLGAIAEGTGSVAKKLLQAGQAIGNVLAPFRAAAGSAVNALGAVAKGGYQLAEASESLVLDIIPFGRTAKGIGQQFVLPAATFAAASHLPGGHLIAEGLTNVATGAISPLAHGAAGGAIDAATGFISHAVPNVFGIQSHITGAVSGGISSLADAATGVLGQAGAAVLGGKTITAIAGRGVNAAGNAAIKALAPGEGVRALGPAANKALPSAERKAPEGARIYEADEPIDYLSDVLGEKKPLPEAQPKPTAIPLPDLKAEAKGELVPVEEAKPVATTPKKSLVKVAQEKGAQAGEFVGKAVDTYEAVKKTTETVVSKTQQAAGAIADTGKQALNLVRQINPENALEEAEKLAANFRNSYKGLQDTLKAQAKALRKGDFSAAKKLGEQAEFLAANVVKLADKAQQDVTEIVSSLGDAAAPTTKLGQQLNNRKSQISQAKNKAERVQRVGKVTDTSGVIDVAATSTPVNDEESLAAFGDLNKIIEQQKQNLLELAKGKLNDKAFVKDQIVNAGGFIGGKIGEQFGPVGELGGDILGSLATRQALVLGEAGNNAFNALKDTDEFKQAGKFQKLILLIQQLKKELQSPELQKALGGELTGDITGFVIGNLAGKLGTAGLQSLAGTVPGAGVLAAIPGKGALAAKLGVDPVVKARDRFNAGDSESEEGGLAAFPDVQNIINQQRQRLERLLALGSNKEGLSQAEIQARLAELDAEVNQEIGRRVSDRIDAIETQVALDDGTSIGVTEAPDITQRRIKKQQEIKLTPEQEQQFAALEIETARDPNEDLAPDSLVKAARFDAAAERISNQVNNTFEKGAEQDPLAPSKSGGGDRLKQAAAKELGEYGAALQKGIGQFGVDLSKLPATAQSVFAKLTEGPELLNNAFKGLLGNVGNLVKGFLAFQAINFAQGLLSNFAKEALDAALKLDNLKTALNFASGSSAAGAGNLEFVRKTVDDLKVPLGAAQQGFVKLAASTRSMTGGDAIAKDLFTGVSQVATVLGLTSDESNGVLLAFSQMASKGKISMEEILQVAERVPGTFSLFARALGVSEGELNKLLETGQVFSEEALPKFGKQLQSEFGGAAVNASKNAQSAVFEFGNSVQTVQESLGKGLQPFQVTGLNVASAALKLVADRGDALIRALTILGLVMAKPLFESLLTITSGLKEAGLALARDTIATQRAAIAKLGLANASKEFGKGMLAATAGIRSFLLEMALVYGALEGGKALFEAFVPTGLGADFKDFADQGVQGLKRIEDAARKARGEVDALKPDPTGKVGNRQGMDEGLESQGMNLGLFKSDDVVKAVRSNAIARRVAGPLSNAVPGLSAAGAVLGITEKATGETGKFNPFVTNAERQYNMALEQAKISKKTGEDLKKRVFDTSGIQSQISSVSDLDKQIKGNQKDLNKEKKSLNPDKNRIKQLSAEQAGLQKRRDEAAAPLTELQNQIDSNLQGAKAQIEAINNTKGMSPENAKQLRAPYEAMVADLEKAQQELNKLQAKSGAAIDPVRALASAFLKVQTTLEEAGRAAEKAFLTKSLAIAQEKVKGFSTDRYAGRNAAVKQATAERDQAAATVNDQQTAFDTLKAKLDEPGAKEALGEISVDDGNGKLKPITIDSSIAEIEAAKKTLGDKDAAKKQILDDLKTYKESEPKLQEVKVKLANSDATVKQVTEEATLAPIQDRARANESNIQKDANRQLAGVKAAATARVLTEDQAAIQTAKIQERTTQKQIEEAQRQLGEYRAAKDAGSLSAEQFAQKELETSDKISQLQLQKEEQKSAQIEATRRKRINELDLANQKAESAIAISQTTATTATKQKVLSGGLTQEDAAIEQTETQEDTTRKRIAQIKRELQQNEQLRADGTRDAKDATQKELQLKQQLAEANGQLVDSEIQKQEQLRAAIAATFQRQQEQLKLFTKQSANQIDRDALDTLKSGPVDAKGLDLQTQSLKLKNDGSEIGQNLSFAQQELAALDALGQQDQAAADKRRALALQIADLQGQLIANEKEQFLNAREQEIHAIEERAAAQKRASEEAIAGVQQQKDANDLLLSSLDAQTKLLESRKGLQQALNEVDLARLGGESKGADRSLNLRQKLNDKKLDPTVRKEAERQLKSEGFNPNTSELKILERKQALEDSIAAKKLAALEAEQEFQRRALDLDLQRQKIAAQNLVFEAEIAKLRSEANQAEARSNLEIAKKSGDSTKIAEAQAKLNLADREVGLSDRKLANAQSNLGLQDELASNALQTQGAKQQAERINFNTDEESRESERGLTLAEAIGKRGRGGRRTFGPRSSRSGGRSVPEGAQIRASEGVDPSIGRTSPQVPSSRPVEIPSNNAPSPNNKMTELNDSLRLAVSALTAMRPQIDKIAQELSKPRVENLYVSSPQPVSDAGSILSDIAYQGAVGAGLA